MPKPKTTLVICHGNICRSPVVYEKLKQLGLKNLQQAGLRDRAHHPRRSPKKIRDWAEENGIDLEDHRSAYLTQEMVDNAHTILYMDTGNRRRLWANYIIRKQRLINLGNVLGEKRIKDPNFLPKDSNELRDVLDSLLRASTKYYRSFRTPKDGSPPEAK